MTKGPKGEKRPADLNRRAFDIVRIATGETDDAGPNPGGGNKGGKARAAKLSPEERKRIAQSAAVARWRKGD